MGDWLIDGVNPDDIVDIINSIEGYTDKVSMITGSQPYTSNSKDSTILAAHNTITKSGPIFKPFDSFLSNLLAMNF